MPLSTRLPKISRQRLREKIARRYFSGQTENAESRPALPVAPHTVWFHCFLRSLGWGIVAFFPLGAAAAIRPVGIPDTCGISAAKLVTVASIKFTAAATRAA